VTNSTHDGGSDPFPWVIVRRSLILDSCTAIAHGESAKLGSIVVAPVPLPAMARIGIKAPRITVMYIASRITAHPPSAPPWRSVSRERLWSRSSRRACSMVSSDSHLQLHRPVQSYRLTSTFHVGLFLSLYAISTVILVRNRKKVKLNMPMLAVSTSMFILATVVCSLNLLILICTESNPHIACCSKPSAGSGGFPQSEPNSITVPSPSQ
jgi:hypothetical protein